MRHKGISNKIFRPNRHEIDGDTARIYFNRSDKFTVVDAKRIPELVAKKWFLISTGYVWSSDKVAIHRLLANPGPGMIVDHLDGDRLNNRMANLRVCTYQENGYNYRKSRTHLTSKFKGVSWVKSRQRWVAYITVEGKRKTLGYFEDEILAAQTYNSAAILNFGEFALINKFDENGLHL